MSSSPYIIRHPRDGDAAWTTRECLLARDLLVAASREAVVRSFRWPSTDIAGNDRKQAEGRVGRKDGGGSAVAGAPFFVVALLSC